MPQLSRDIAGFEGTVWLLDALLLLLAMLLYLLRQEFWPVAAVTGALLSQLLISLSWSDAKYGTLLNLFILAVSIPALAQWRFQEMVAAEAASLLAHAETTEVSKMRNLEELPEIVQKWLETSGAAAGGEIYNVHLEQLGKMRTSPKGKWMNFTAEQNFSVNIPGFVWQVKVDAFPGLQLNGRDKLHNGHGEMLIKALGIFPVADEKGNDKIDSGSLLRYLGEICWFPLAAKASYLNWKAAGPTSAIAQLNWKDKQVNGTFNFSPQGKLLSFEAIRYYGSGKDARPETWHIDILENAIFEGVLLPSKCRVTWKLPEGDFTWLELQITSVEYNVSG
ncbi:MAG: DUF6544 family protein [Salinimicrobium sp.]